MKLKNLFKNCVLSLVLVSAPLYPWYIQAPQDLGKWLETNFTYQSEVGDYWKTPEETIRDKGGDCEDLSILAEYVLRDLKYEAWFIVMLNRTEGDSAHAITIIKEKNNTYSFISNTQYILSHLSSWELMLDKYWPNYKEVYICKTRTLCKSIYTIEGE